MDVYVVNRALSSLMRGGVSRAYTFSPFYKESMIKKIELTVYEISILYYENPLILIRNAVYTRHSAHLKYCAKLCKNAKLKASNFESN